MAEMGKNHHFHHDQKTRLKNLGTGVPSSKVCGPGCKVVSELAHSLSRAEQAIVGQGAKFRKYAAKIHGKRYVVTLRGQNYQSAGCV